LDLLKDGLKSFKTLKRQNYFILLLFVLS